ncbi:fenitrothion hydrolase [Solirubrobacter sp. CPCC 204708]|uniref:Fenitrothion hydrolase n=1 Tax=Solirubrobacter deserti TaxID=2282478 RepID=A0ABT4RPC1_9ACTN|nr:fenitrothion hydrolase [Solirubrobacter deserti]MBE2315702.1 fenitrothion hydrolase [Solirubrobacter deserti]MDA0140409.1 fenitrothion hydrolase [Solirubrobacter deserti]
MWLLAHGLVGRADLPIPFWLFAWCTAAVVALSFAGLGAAWSTPRFAGDRFRPLPDAVSRVLTSRAVEIACGALGVVLLLAVIASGLLGTQIPGENLAPTFVYVAFWLGFVPLSVLFGDVFAAFNPWRAVGRAVGWAFRGVGAEPLAYPARLGYYPAAVGLLCFAALELISARGDRPGTIAIAALVYSAVTWIAMGVFGVDTWSRRGEAFGVYFNLFSRLSAFERRGRQIGVRPLLSGLAQLGAQSGLVAVVMVMIGTVTFDGLSAGPTWLSNTRGIIGSLIDAGVSPRAAVELVWAVGMWLIVLAICGLYALAMSGAHTVERRFSTRELARRFAPSLVPIGLAYAAAHYVSLLVFQGQLILPRASDPLGEGWDLFGAAGGQIDLGVLSAEAFWYLQTGFVVTGHVAALALAHDRALVLYGDPGRALRSQRWMLAIMITFTVLALWLLSEAAEG